MINNFGGRASGKSALPANFPGATWDTRTDAEAGFNTTALNSFITEIGGTDNFVSRAGYQVRQNGTATTTFDWASASKPLMSLMVLFMLNDGDIASIDETLNTNAGVNFTFTGNDADITWKNLMSMTSGYSSTFDSDVNFNYSDYAIGLFRQALKDANSPTTLESYLAGKLTSLGLQDGTIFNANIRADTTCRDMARIGWWVANQFDWNGTQLLPASYYSTYIISQVPDAMTASTATAVDNYLSGESVTTYGGGNGQSSFGPGIYGCNMWLNDFVAETANRCWPSAPTDTIVFDGHFGTEILAIMPSLKIVAAWKGTNQGFTGTADSGLDTALGLLADAVI